MEGSFIVKLKETADQNGRLIKKNDITKKSLVATPFGEHSTGQRKTELEYSLGIKGKGKVAKIFETINAVQIQMDAHEAYKLSLDDRVEYVEPVVKVTPAFSQSNPGWGLDRLDEGAVLLDSNYSSTYSGAGQTIWILDSGLNLNVPAVAAEFSGRASIFFDVSGNGGVDCGLGHGTMVASAAAGNTQGSAKGATLQIVRIKDANCSGDTGTDTAAFNWLAANVPAGTIVNYSQSIQAPYTFVNGVPIFTCGTSTISSYEASIRAAHDAGIIVVVAAGNDGCNTANYSPANIPEAFVVGATQNSMLSLGMDALAQYSGNGGSRIGTNISVFVPGKDVAVLNSAGTASIVDGTSISAPYVAGVFAVVCQAVGTYCSSPGTAAAKYDALRNTGLMGTVTNSNGTPLTGSTSRFLVQRW